MSKKKRQPRRTPDRDSFYMGEAIWAESRSKDPFTQVGAKIVSSKNVPLGTGYNGPPAKYKDIDIDWSRPGKNDWMIHAERNAIDYSNQALLPGSTLYVTANPCKICALEIVKKEIARVVYMIPQNPDPKSSLTDPENIEKVKDIFKKGDVKFELFDGNLNWMRDRMEILNRRGIFQK